DGLFLVLFFYFWWGVFLVVFCLLFHLPAGILANLGAGFFGSCALHLKAAWASGSTGPGRLRVAVDMDEVIADTLTRHLEWYNRTTGENLSPELIAQIGLEAAIPAKHRELFENIPHQPGFFADLGVLEKSQLALRILDPNFE